MKKITIGAIAMVVHCLAVSLLDANFRISFEELGVTQYQYGSFSVFFSFLILLPICIHKRVNPIAYVDKNVLMRSAIASVDQLLLYYAFAHAVFVDIIAVTLVYPIITTALSAIFLKETINGKKLTSLLLGFCGGLIIINPLGSSFSIYSRSALAAITLWGILDILLKKAVQEKCANIYSPGILRLLYHDIFITCNNHNVDASCAGVSEISCCGRNFIYNVHVYIAFSPEVSRYIICNAHIFFDTDLRFCHIVFPLQ